MDIPSVMPSSDSSNAETPPVHNLVRDVSRGILFAILITILIVVTPIFLVEYWWQEYRCRQRIRYFDKHGWPK